MTTRAVVGLVIAGIGAALVPVGWYSSRLIWLGSLLLFVVGFLMFFTARVAANEADRDSRATVNPAPVKEGGPGDIHNYSGWRDGGRSLGGADGDGGGGGDGD